MIPLQHLSEQPDAVFADALEARLARIVAEPSTEEEGPIMAIDLEDDRTVTLGPSRRPRWLLAAAALVLLVVGIAALARRGNDSSTSTVGPNPKSVKFAIDLPDIPSPENTSSDRTFMRVFSGKNEQGTVTGDLSGKAEGVAVFDSGRGYPRGGYIASDGHVHSMGVATYTIDGSIAGCGEGTIMVTEIVDAPASASTGKDEEWSGTWQVVAGGSTKNLQHVTGSGTSSGNVWGQDLTGSLSCG
jgi:hypothetical protein